MLLSQHCRPKSLIIKFYDCRFSVNARKTSIKSFEMNCWLHFRLCLLLLTGSGALFVPVHAAEQRLEPRGLPHVEWLRPPPMRQPSLPTVTAAVHEHCMALASGDREAYYRLGWLYFTGRGVGRDPERAAGWFQRGAAAGDPLARQMLARLAQVTPQPDDLCQHLGSPPAWVEERETLSRAWGAVLGLDFGRAWALWLGWY